MRVLSPTLTKAITTMHWSLDPSPPPLHFRPLEDMHNIRQKQEAAGDDHNPLYQWLRKVDHDDSSSAPTTKTTMADALDTFCESNDDDADSRYYFGWISLAVVALGNGWTDECHDLVTPLSWPDDISFAHGPSKYDQVGPEVSTYATFVHCLVHRKEAFHRGEFGMMGFANANYWGSAFTRASAVDRFPHRELCEAVRETACEYSSSEEVTTWMRQHGFDDKDKSFYDPTAVHELCAAVLKQGDACNASFKAFAEQVATGELKILLQHALPKAGYKVPSQLTTN